MANGVNRRLLSNFFALITSFFLMGATTTWDFSNAGDYTVNPPGQIVVSGGVASLFENTPWLIPWPVRKTISIGNTTGTSYTNQLVRVDIGSNQTDFWSYYGATTSNSDICFTDSTGAILTTYLATWTPSPAGSQTATFWVRVPSIPTGQTTDIFMYFGNIGASCSGRTTDVEAMFGAGVPDSYPGTAPVDYVLANLGSNRFNDPPSASTFIGTLGDEGVTGIDLSTYFGSTYFPYWGTNRYRYIRIHANGCVMPNTSNSGTPNCPWASLNDSAWSGTLNSRVIDPYAQDQWNGSGVGSDNCSQQGVFRNPSPNSTVVVIRWCAHPYGNDGTDEYQVRLFRNGNIQFDYADITGNYLTPCSSYPCPPVVAIGRGVGGTRYTVPGYNRAPNTAPLNQANSVKFYAIPTPSLTQTISGLQTRYPTSNPMIENTAVRPAFASLLRFQETGTYQGLPNAGIRYILSADGTNWYRWGGAGWIASNGTYDEASPTADVSANIRQFPYQGNIYWRAFLHSNGQLQVILDDITMDYSQSRADGQIKISGDPTFQGDNVYNTDGTNQTAYREVDVQAGPITTVFVVKIQNDGVIADSFTVTAPAQPNGCTAGCTLIYYDAETGGNDITAQIAGAGWNTGTLAVSASTTIRAELTINSNAPGGVTFTIPVTATSDADKAVLDVVVASASARIFYSIDGLIATDAGLSDAVGDGIYNSDGTNQTKSLTVVNNATATYYVRLENEGNTTDNVRVKGPQTNPSGWTVTYWDAFTGGNNITGSVMGAGRVFAIPQAGTQDIRIEITPDRTVEGNASYDVLLTSTSVSDATKVDAVKAHTTVILFRQADLSIGLQPLPSMRIGNDVYTPPDPVENQTLQQATTGQTLTYYFWLENDGNVLGNFTLRADTAPPAGWTARYYTQQTGGADITSAILGGYTVQIPKFSLSGIYRLEVTPDVNTLNAGDTFAPGITLTPVQEPQKSDKVIAESVVGPIYRPDVLASSDNIDYIGNNLFDPTQIVSRDTGPGVTATYYFRVQNDGNTSDQMRISGTAGSGQWDVKYYDAISGGTDITGAVTAGSYITATLNRNEEVFFRGEVTAASGSLGDLLEISFTATSVFDGTRSDTVKARTRLSYMPDLSIDQDNDINGAIGRRIINTNATGQSLSRVANTGSPAIYYIFAENIGLEDEFLLTGTPPTSDGWDIHYFDEASGSEITALLTSTGWRTGTFSTGNYRVVRLEVTPTSQASGTTKTVAVQVRSLSAPGAADAVKAVTSRQTPPNIFYGTDLQVDNNGNNIQGAPGTGLGGSSTKTVVDGQTASYSILLRNTGNTSDTYQFTWVTPSGFTAVLNDGTADRASGYITPVVTAGGSMSFTFKVTKPTPPFLGNDISQTFIVDAVSQGDPTKSDSLEARANIQAIRYGVDGAIDGNGAGIIGAPNSGAGGSSSKFAPPGNTANFDITIVNTGNVNDLYTFNFLGSPPPGWAVGVYYNNVLLGQTPVIPPGSSFPQFPNSLQLRITSPTSASAIQTFILNMVSSGDGTKADSLRALVNPVSPATASLKVEKGGVIPEFIQVYPGNMKVSMLQLKMTADPTGNDIRLKGLSLFAQGTGNDAYPNILVKLWTDTDGDGKPNGTTPLATGYYANDNGIADLTLAVSEVIPKGTTRTYVVTYDFASNLSASAGVIGAPISGATSHTGKAGGLPLLFALTLVAGLGLGFRRRSLLATALVLLVAVGLFTSCNGGGGAGPSLPPLQFWARITSNFDVRAEDAVTSSPAEVIVVAPPIESAKATLVP